MTYGTLWLHENTWHLDAQPHVAMKAKRVFGRLSFGAKGVLTIQSSPEICRDLEWFIDRYPLAVDTRSAEHLASHAAVHRDTIKRLEDILGPEYQPRTIGLTKPPRSYQAREAEILQQVGGLLVGDDVGLGKTVTAIAAAVLDGKGLPALVVCQPHLVTQWREKFEEFAPELSTHILRKSAVYDLPIVKGSPLFGGPSGPRTPDVIISSYGKTSGGWAQVLARYCNLVVFDEVQELRHMDTQRYQAAAELCHGIRFRLGLSATPIYNYGGEIFSIVNLLRPGVLGTQAEFWTEWCSSKGDKAKLEDPNAFGTWARDNFIIIRHTRKEVGRELPPVTRIIQPVDSDSRELDTVKNAAAQLARLILAADPLERGVKWEAARDLSVMLRKFTGIAKAPAAADFVRMLLEQGESVMLCGWHRQVYEIWERKLLDFRPILYTGTESPAGKDAAKKAFIEKRSQLLILSLRSGAGLDGLQDVCTSIVFGELDWSPGVHEQCIGRIARDGQNHGVMAYFLVSDDGSDPTIVEMLGLKREQKEGIMNPNINFLERVDEGGDHVRRLAEAYLKQIGERVPAQQKASA